MSLLDLFRQKYMSARVIDKYRTSNGSIGLILEGYDDQKRYHVKFTDGYKGPNIENLYGLLSKPFSGKTEYLDRLIYKGDEIELTVSYSKDPFRKAYRLYSVSSSPAYNRPNRVFQTPYRYSNALPY
jgi:hypothetical protein